MTGQTSQPAANGQPVSGGQSLEAGGGPRVKIEQRRQDGLHRVQIGLTGLAGVILLVGLANIVIDKARMDEQTVPPPVVPTLSSEVSNAASPREPLAELGVTPSAEQSGQVVPDLQPDPALNKPMDRDPQ